MASGESLSPSGSNYSRLAVLLQKDPIPWKVEVKDDPPGQGSSKSKTYRVKHTEKNLTFSSNIYCGDTVVGDEDSTRYSEDMVYFAVDDEKIKANKKILMKYSDYFHAMFSIDMKESKQTVIELQDVTATALHSVLKFCHHGSVVVCSDHVHHLLHAANLFQIWHISSACEHFLCSVISRNNLLDILDLADHYSALNVLQASFKFIRDNFEELSIRGTLTNLKSDHLVALLQGDFHINSSEYDIFQFVKKWVETDLNTRTKLLPDLISHIRFPLMSLHELTKIHNGKESWLKSCPSYQKQMDWTFWYKNHIHEQPLHQSLQTRPRGMEDCLMAFMEDDSILHQGNLMSVHVSPIRGKRKFTKKCLKLEWRRDGNAVCTWNGFLYIAGGYDPEADRNLSLVHRFDPATRSWIRVQSMLHRKASFRMDSLGDRIVVTGGRQCDSILRSGSSYTTLKTLDVTEWYDCRVDQWIQASNMPAPLYGHASASLGDRLYICGGRSDNTSTVCDTPALYSYTPSEDRWESHAPMHHHRYYHSMAATAGKLYVVGGINYEAFHSVWNFIQDVDMYDPTTGQWSVLAPLPHRRSQVGIAAHSSGAIFVLGGLPVPRVDGRRVVLEYDIKKDLWETSVDLEFPTYWPTTCCILKLTPDLYRPDDKT